MCHWDFGDGAVHTLYQKLGFAPKTNCAKHRARRCCYEDDYRNCKPAGCRRRLLCFDGSRILLYPNGLFRGIPFRREYHAADWNGRTVSATGHGDPKTALFPEDRGDFFTNSACHAVGILSGASDSRRGNCFYFGCDSVREDIKAIGDCLAAF